MKNKEVYRNIGFAIRKLRIDRGYQSAEKFALDHEFNRTSYWRLESGKPMDMNMIIRICDAHKITIQKFFELVNI